jgi:hypothetical protein
VVTYGDPISTTGVCWEYLMMRVGDTEYRGSYNGSEPNRSKTNGGYYSGEDYLRPVTRKVGEPA